ncbi:MAG: protein kinase [Methanoregulaceae archaeon]
MRKTQYRIILLFLAGLLIFVPPVAADILVNNGTHATASIQSLINSSSNGDTVLLTGGRYYENLVITRQITLGALDPRNPPEIISGSGSAAITLVSEGVILDTLVLSGNATNGLIVQSDNNKIYNVSIQGFPAGFNLKSAVHNEISRNIVINNSVGVVIDRNSEANTFYLNYFNNRVDLETQSGDVSWTSVPWEYRYDGRSYVAQLGNHWKKYQGSDANNDGIGDVPYTLTQNSTTPPDIENFSATTDLSPLIKFPAAYTLVQVRSPGAGTSTSQQAGGVQNVQPNEESAIVQSVDKNTRQTSQIISTENPGGPPALIFRILLDFWWLILVIIVVSAAAGIWFERSRKKGSTTPPDEYNRGISPGNATVVTTRHDTGQIRESADSHHYAAQLPPALENKYPDAIYLAEGGVSRVFRAHDTKENRDIAVKVPIRFDEVTGTQFTKELQIWEGLHHKNIVEIYAANIFPVPYIEMEYVGTPLETLKFPLTVEKATEIIAGVAEGLSYAHGQGIVHRDIKPGNILIAPDGTPKITDWGLSKAAGTKQSGIIGFSLEYASPEQLAPNLYGEPGVWTDIYQIGVLYYEMLTGRLPFKGGGMGEITQAILHDAPAPLAMEDVNAALLEDILLKCLQKNPKDRYDSVGEFLADLKKIRF